MAAIPKLEETRLQAICGVIGDTAEGLTGSEIGQLLTRCGIDDPMPSMTKRHRLFEALRAKQERNGCANNVLAFVQTELDPVRFIGNAAGFAAFRDRLNEALAFSGLHLGEDGKLQAVSQARTLDEAQERAGRLRSELARRRVHHDVLQFCRAELLQNNYFHAVFEATKSVAEKIRQRSGLTGDGAELVTGRRCVRAQVATACDQHAGDNPILGYCFPFRQKSGYAQDPCDAPARRGPRRSSSKSPEEAKLVAEVRRLAERCAGGVHLYLKFVGD